MRAGSKPFPTLADALYHHHCFCNPEIDSFRRFPCFSTIWTGDRAKDYHCAFQVPENFLDWINLMRVGILMRQAKIGTDLITPGRAMCLLQLGATVRIVQVHDCHDWYWCGGVYCPLCAPLPVSAHQSLPYSYILETR